MKILDAHQKNKIRYENGDIVLYEPNLEQKRELKDFLSKNIKMDENMNVDEELAFGKIRWIIREMTSIGNEIDDLSDSELSEKIDNGDEAIEGLIKAITKLLNDIIAELYQDYIDQMRVILDTIELNKKNAELETMKYTVVKLLNDAGIEVDMEKILQEKENINKEIDEVKGVIKNEEKTEVAPTPKKKRGRPKKVKED